MPERGIKVGFNSIEPELPLNTTPGPSTSIQNKYSGIGRRSCSWRRDVAGRGVVPGSDGARRLKSGSGWWCKRLLSGHQRIAQIVNNAVCIVAAGTHADGDFAHQFLAVPDPSGADAGLQVLEVPPGSFTKNAFTRVIVIFMAMVTTVAKILQLAGEFTSGLQGSGFAAILQRDQNLVYRS